MKALPVQSIVQMDETVRSGMSGAGRIEGGPSRQQPAGSAEKAPADWSQVVEQLSAAQVNMPANIGLKFRINDETNEVTVYVIDRTSKQVLRTIPPEEISNLKAGDLVELFA